MGRRHTKILLYLLMLLLVAIPLYFLLDSTTTVEIPIVKPKAIELDRLELVKPILEKPLPKKDYHLAPTVPRPKFVPYPTKAKPGVPWMVFEQTIRKNNTVHAQNDTSNEVVIQRQNSSLVYTKYVSTIVPVPKDDAGFTRNPLPASDTVSPGVDRAKPVVQQSDNVQPRERHAIVHRGGLIGGMILAPSELPQLGMDKKEADSRHVIVSSDDNQQHDKLAVSSTASPTPAVPKHAGNKTDGSVENWKNFFDYQDDIPRQPKFDEVPKASNQTKKSELPNDKARSAIMSSNGSVAKSQDTDWRSFFDRADEVQDNNAHVRADLKVPIIGMKHVYPTKARPAAPRGVDFYRRKGKDAPPPEVNIVGGEEPMETAKTKVTDPYDVFDEEAKLQSWDAGVKRDLPALEGENIISMTLYGSDPRYTMGAIRNAEMVTQNFPGWKLRVYTETPSENPRYGAVPNTVLSSLRQLGAELNFMQAGEDFIPPMMWRFLVADDTWVSRFLVRDADARLTERDAAAVFAWVRSGKSFNCIRDHPSHAGYAISGGMWGGKPQEIRNVLRRSWRELMKGVRSDYLQDMNFLNLVIWPKLSAHAYCSDSVSCESWLGAHPFPVPRYGYEHVGQVFNEHDLGRPIDIKLLRSAGENTKCSPREELRVEK